MKKRLGIALGILLSIVLVAVLAIPESRLTIQGYLRGQNRFQGRPTSYWRFKVESYASYSGAPATTRTSYWDKLLKLLSITNSHSRPDKPALLEGKQEALPVLIDLIRDKTSLTVTHEAYEAVSAMGRPIAKDVLPFLEEEINGQDPFFRMVAVRTLGRFGPDGIPPLIKALKHDSPQVRISAAWTLEEIGYGPKGLVPRDAVLALVEALNDEVADVRTSAAHALVTIDPDEAEKVHAERFIPRLPGFLSAGENGRNPP